MDTSSPILEVLISALPVLILVVLLGFYMAGLYWREDTRRKMKEYLKHIRSHDIALQRFNALLAKFSEIENTPPFNIQFRSISQKLNELNDNRNREMRNYTHLRAEMDEHNKKGIIKRLSAPYHWMQTHQKLHTLEHIDVVVTENVIELDRDVHQLSQIQNGIARQVANTWQEIQELEQNVQLLLQRGISADHISAYKHIHHKLRQKFTSIPADLLTSKTQHSTNDDLLKHIVDAHAILEETKPALEKPLADTRLWMEQVQLLPQAIEQVSSAAITTKTAIHALPRAIDPSPFYETLKEAQLAVEYAQQFSQQIDPHHLEAILEELARQYETLQTCGKEIKSAEHVLEEYQQHRERLADQWQAVEGLFSQLTESPILPLQFTATAEEVQNFRNNLTGFADLRNAYTVSHFEEELPLLKEHINSVDELHKDLLTMQTAQAELMTLMNRLQQSKLTAWIQKTHAALQQLEEFSAENYLQPPNWQEKDVKEEIQEIERKFESLPELSQAISEENLLQHWKTAQEVDKLIAALQDGINNQLQQRKALIELEEKLSEEYTAFIEMLEQLNGAQLAQPEVRQIRRYRRQLDSFKQELAKRTEGTLAAKEEQFISIQTEMNKLVDEWLKEVQETLQTDTEELIELENKLTEKVSLNDPLLESIRTFLAEEDMEQSDEEETGETPIQQFLYIKEMQQTTGEFLNELKPLHADVMQKMDAFQETQNAFNTTIHNAEEIMDFTSSWDQNVINLERIQKQGQQLEQEMGNFQHTEHHPQNLIRKLDQYIRRYQDLHQRLTSLVSKVMEEQTQQEQAENEFQRTVQQWEQVTRIWGNDRTVDENVESLVSRYQKRFREIQQNFERGRIRFSSYIDNLNTLKKHLSNEVITNQDNRNIEISGREYI